MIDGGKMLRYWPGESIYQVRITAGTRHVTQTFQLKEISMGSRTVRKISLFVFMLLLSIAFSTGAAVISFAAENQSLQSSPEFDCSDSNLITLGYKYGSGTNPYSLQGKCIKLHNVRAMQYFGKDRALASWSYRGQHGVVYLETRNHQELLGDSRVAHGMCVGVYTYKSVLDSPTQVPRIIVSE